MSLDANKTLARRIWDEVFNHRNLALADELVAPDAVSHESRAGRAQRPREPQSHRELALSSISGRAYGRRRRARRKRQGRPANDHDWYPSGHVYGCRADWPSLRAATGPLPAH